MRIIQIIPSLDVGGAEKLVTELVINFDKSKHEIYLIVLFGAKNTIFEQKIIKNNINVIFLDKKKGLDISIIFKLRKLIKKLKPDVINTHLNTLPYISFASCFMLNRPKIFHTFHTIAEKEVSGKLKCIYRFIFKFFKINVIGISRLVSESINKSYKLKKVLTIYNGIDYNFFYSNKPINERKIDFICVGSLIYVKNQEVIIDAMRIVVEKYPNSRLILLGKGDLKEYLENKVKENKLDGNVEFMGAVSNVNEYLSNSKVFLMSSHWEGNPLSLLEASAAGCVIVSTKVGGIIDIIEDGINGYFSDKTAESFAEKMIYILENELEIIKIINNNQQKVAEYDIKKICNEYIRVYMN